MIEVPFMKPWLIEMKANKILEQAKAEGLYDGDSQTPLDTICDQQLGLKYLLINLPQTESGEDVAGYIAFNKSMIVLNDLEYKNSYHKGRINFTIAHEIGHWVLHKSLYDYDTPRFILFHTEYKEEGDKLEWQANHFSACLLMPRNLVIKKWNELQFYSVQEKRSILADFFRVSLETMNIRLTYLQLI